MNILNDAIGMIGKLKDSLGSQTQNFELLKQNTSSTIDTFRPENTDSFSDDIVKLVRMILDKTKNLLLNQNHQMRLQKYFKTIKVSKNDF